MLESDNTNITLHNPFIFNEDFCEYAEALYNLKKKHPEMFLQLHEYATNFLTIYDAVQEVTNTALPTS